MSSTELVTREKYDLDAVEGAAEIWREELGDDFAPQFPRIKVPGGGGTTWEIDEDSEPTKELTAVVVAHHKSTRLYLDSFDDSEEGSSNRPDAWSVDGKVQEIPAETFEKIDRINAAGGRNGQQLPYPERDLKKCPYYQFETAGLVGGKGKGKATREYRELFLLIEGSPVPYQLSVPATSLKTWDSFASSQVMKGRRLSAFETKITLSKVKGGGSVEYSTVHFARGNDLEPTLQAQALEFARGVKALVTRDPFAGESVEDAAPARAAQVVGETTAPVEQVQQDTPAQPAPAAAQTEPVAVAAGSVTEDEIDF